MNRLFFLCFVCMCVGFTTRAQTTIVHCANDIFLQQTAKNNPALNSQINQLNARLNAASVSNARTTTTIPLLPDTVITIPVVVHIIHNNSDGSIGGANISDAQIQSQIDVLNKDYRRLNADTANAPSVVNAVGADVKFNFCLATIDPNGNATNGITRTYSSQVSFIYPTDETTVKALSYWPSNQYLNIWVCNLFLSNTTQVLLGITQFPGGDTLSGLAATDGNALTDGLLVNYQSFGTTGSTLLPQYALGRTVTHEIGHWFGLFHPWGIYNSGDCTLSDYCNDTPVCGDPYYASAPSCNSSSFANNPPVNCSDRRMFEDFMEYSDDGCMNIFTQDQKTRMRLALVLSPRRLALLSANNHCNASITATTAPVITAGLFLNVFPNPATDIITIQTNFSSTQKLEYKIYNAMGQFVYDSQEQNPLNGMKQINLSGYASGIYFIQVSDGSQQIVKRIVKL